MLEILVVMIIIGILVGMVALSIQRPQTDSVRTEAERLQALLEFAGQEAMLQGKEFGVVFSPHGYEFRQLTGNGWQPVQDEPALRARRLPGVMRVRLKADGAPVTLEGEAARGVHLYVLSSGELTPFELTLEAGDTARVALQGTLTGRLKVVDARS